MHLMQKHPRICPDGYKGRAEALMLCHVDVKVLAILDRTEGMRLHDTSTVQPYPEGSSVGGRAAD